MIEWRLNDRCVERLLDWYRREHRSLPWRETRDPYRVLVSEIMLQQTQVERVIPKYHQFLERFPSLEALAAAPASEVIRAWSGLGYNRRALNLQRACQEVVERYGGRMPSDPDELARLPGIGPYTAGAVACFAFGADVGFADTNIRRVLHRVLAGPELPAPSMSLREIECAARELVPRGRGYEWNQALMELGARLCRARSVACERCPLGEVCAARPTISEALGDPILRNGKAEPKFETTSRYFRGRVVEALRAAPIYGLSLAEIGRLLKPDFNGDDYEWLGGLVGGLVRDGLVTQTSAPAAGIREDLPPYAAGAPDLSRRYRLPD